MSDFNIAFMFQYTADYKSENNGFDVMFSKLITWGKLKGISNIYE